MQMQGDFVETPVGDAFDAVINIPHTTVIENVLR
jgi:hypothetical protein